MHDGQPDETSPCARIGNCVPNWSGGVKLAASDYTFSGWNTKPDGSGIQYNGRDALDAIGRDSGVSDLTLYANWKTKITFDANGGKLAGGTSSAEKALTGKSNGEIAYSVNQTAATGLLGEKENYTFVQWNTKADGTGTSLEKYGKITRPVTFYAIYYQSQYYYTGSEQVFRAPVNGWYRVDLWGAQGGADSYAGGKGAYVSGEVYVTAGTNLYVYVGAPGIDDATGAGAGYNGGGNPGANGWSGSGGGATDIRTISGNWNTKAGLESRIAVAASGGGGGAGSAGGYGGALAGGSGGAGLRGGTQTTAGQRGTFGCGGTPEIDGGGGGGGWYGGGASSGSSDVGGGGGSSYLSGFDGCVTSPTGYTFRNGQMIAGNEEMPKPDGGTEIGHTGECRARITLIEINCE